MQATVMDNLDADYTPRYIRLARLLRRRIQDGTYPPGSLLPSSKQLAADHDVSPTTAIHALEVLESSSYVKYVVGKPFLVVYGA